VPVEFSTQRVGLMVDVVRELTRRAPAQSGAVVQHRAHLVLAAYFRLEIGPYRRVLAAARFEHDRGRARSAD
jgi:hypothetical protein